MRPLIACLLILPLLIGGCDRQSQGQEQAAAPRLDTNAANAVAGQTSNAVTAPVGTVDRSHVGAAEPDTSFLGPDGKPMTLADFRGKPVLVNLWATWCAPCVAEMPRLDALAASAPPGLRVVAISQDMNGAKAVTPFFQAHGFKALQPYLDPQLGLSLALGVNLPTTILYDATGHEVWRMLGDYDWTSPKARKLVTEAA